MKANELQIINFLQAPNVQFVIPVYQRNYDWTNTECKELLNDDDAKKIGAVFTPSWLAEKITKNALDYYRKLNASKSYPETIGDLSCGAGVFIHYLNKYSYV